MGYNNSTSILFDTSYIISSTLWKDSNYHSAGAYIAQIDTFEKKYITNYIFLEMATVSSQKLGKLESNRLLQGFLESNIEIIWIDKLLDKKIQLEFLKLKDKNISYVDLATSMIAKANKISAVATFDKHFKKLGKEYGFEVVGV